MRKIVVASFLMLLAITLQGCYSLKSGSQQASLHTLAVPIVGDRSGAGIAQLRTDLTHQLTSSLESQSSLRIIPSITRADALLEGTIVSYSDLPSQLSGATSRAIVNRLILSVQVSLEERQQKKERFNHVFTAFAEYPVGNYAAQQEAQHRAVAAIVEQVVDNVVSDW